MARSQGLKPIVAIPRHVHENKPPHGSPCNRCGACCFATICKLGQRVLDRPALPGPCPALKYNGPGEYSCAIVDYVSNDPQFRDAALIIIRAGEGCDARFNGEPQNMQFVADCDARDVQNIEKIEAAHRLWGIKMENEDGKKI